MELFPDCIFHMTAFKTKTKHPDQLPPLLNGEHSIHKQVTCLMPCKLPRTQTQITDPQLLTGKAGPCCSEQENPPCLSERRRRRQVHSHSTQEPLCFPGRAQQSHQASSSVLSASSSKEKHSCTKNTAPAPSTASLGGSAPCSQVLSS